MSETKAIDYLYDEFTIVDGCPVDPECGLEDEAHVYSEIINGKRMEFSVVLSFVDIENNRNSYYRLQMLESNQKNK